MITTRPEVTPDGRYNQKQAAEILKIDRHTLKRYAENGIIKFWIRKAGNAKVTTGAEIIKCWESCYLTKPI